MGNVLNLFLLWVDNMPDVTKGFLMKVFTERITAAGKLRNDFQKLKYDHNENLSSAFRQTSVK